MLSGSITPRNIQVSRCPILAKTFCFVGAFLIKIDFVSLSVEQEQQDGTLECGESKYSFDKKCKK